MNIEQLRQILASITGHSPIDELRRYTIIAEITRMMEQGRRNE